MHWTYANFPLPPLIIEADANDCKSLTKSKSIIIYTEKIRIVHYIRVIRCTRCQAFSDHTKFFCTWNPHCANCAGRHQTDECTDSKIECINWYDIKNVLPHIKPLIQNAQFIEKKNSNVYKHIIKIIIHQHFKHLTIEILRNKLLTIKPKRIGITQEGIKMTTKLIDEWPHQIKIEENTDETKFKTHGKIRQKKILNKKKQDILQQRKHKK